MLACIECKAYAHAYLGCHEFRSTTESACSRPIPHLFLAQTVICNLDVAVQCEQDIVELQISVNDTVLVEVFQGQADLGCVEPVELVSCDTVVGHP
jgi:hypothetical protein